MQIQIEREKLLKPVSMVVGVVERRQTLPILSYLLLRATDGKISFTGTDLEVEMISEVEGQVDKSGEATLPARKFFDICRALPENATVSLSKQGEKVIVKAGRSRFSLATLATTDFPKVETGSFKEAVSVSSHELKRLFERTAFCMAQQDVRYYLNGLYLETEGKRLRAVATDGHRMAVADTVCESSGSSSLQIIVPRKAIQEMGRFLADTDEELRLEISANHVRLAIKEATFTSKLIDGKFPDYTKVIPNNQSKLVHLNREAFRQALGRVAILANEKYRGIRLNLEEGRLKVTAHNPEQEEAVEEIETSYTGEALEIGFNVNYLMDATAAIESGEVVLGLNDSTSSCTIQAPGSESPQYIVMPMRL